MSDQMTGAEFKEWNEKLSRYGQNHVLSFWDQLTTAEQRHLADDLQTVDLEEMSEMWQKSQSGSSSINTELMQPVEEDLCESVNTSSKEQLRAYEETALRAMSVGEVGVLLLAGGQGTRLGVSYPKGMYDIGLPSRKTLYQIQVERILRLEELAYRLTGKRGSIIMYIMTSEHTKTPTIEYFERNGYFGAKREQIKIFEQRTIPAFDFEGRFIMAAPSKIARSPDGNGGLYWAIKNDGVLDHLVDNGVKYLHVYCVDNVLVKVADPHFVGFCINKRAEAGNKVVEKGWPTEAVGVVVRIEGKIQVVEYSEISKEKAEMRDPSGRLTFRAGNICNHFFTTDFLQRVCNEHLRELPHHIAKKKVPYVDEKTGELVKPDKPNGIKLEKFVFDVFQFCQSFAIWECNRDEEFSPLKNGDGASADTPTTAREALYKLHRKYLTSAGVKLSLDQSEDSCPIVEISPLASYAGEELDQLYGGKTLSTPVHIQPTDLPTNGSHNNNNGVAESFSAKMSGKSSGVTGQLSNGSGVQNGRS